MQIINQEANNHDKTSFTTIRMNKSEEGVRLIAHDQWLIMNKQL